MFMGTAKATEGGGVTVGLAWGRRVGVAVSVGGSGTGVSVREGLPDGVNVGKGDAVGASRLTPGGAVGVGVALAMTVAGGGLGGVGVGGLVQAARSSRPTRSQPTPGRRFMKIRDFPAMFITHTDDPHNQRVPG